MTLHVETLGSGPPLVMLHGWGLHGGVWSTLAARLADRFTLHLVDLPGHGHSRDHPLGDLSQAAAAVAAWLPRDACLVGWSLGGLVAMHIAVRQPPARLVLMATTPCFTARPDWPAAMQPDVLADFARQLAIDYRGTLKNFLALQVLHDSAARATLKALMQQLLARKEPHPDVLEAGLRLLAEGDLRHAVRHITCPTLVLHGGRDVLTPVAAGRWLGANIPDCRYLELADAAHAPFLSHPDAVAAALIRFTEVA